MTMTARLAATNPTMGTNLATGLPLPALTTDDRKGGIPQNQVPVPRGLMSWRALSSGTLVPVPRGRRPYRSPELRNPVPPPEGHSCEALSSATQVRPLRVIEVLRYACTYGHNALLSVVCVR